MYGKMSGSASFNSTFEVSQMRNPIQKTKVDSILSAEAPEFVPRVNGSIPVNLAAQTFHRNQPAVQMVSHNAYRNQNHGVSQYSYTNHQAQGNMKNTNFSVNQRLQFTNTAPNSRKFRSQSNQHLHGLHAHHMQQQQHQIMHLNHQLGSLQITQQPPMAVPGTHSNESKHQSEGNEPTEAAMNALQFLIDTIEKLMNDPGQFENYQKELTTLYIDHADNQHVVSNAIELFFNHSIEEQNFRYTGARLCRLLDSVDPTSESLFRRLLCFKLQYNDTELIQYMNDNETHKVRNTTLFLAELYIQLQNDGSRITNIATSIHHAIGLLMPKTSPENIKCVCQTLKLCGYELDIDFPKETEELMNQLGNCENTDVSTQRLLSSVIELRKNRWGRNMAETCRNIDNAASNSLLVEQPFGKEFSNDPVFYGPDGNILTEEESAFLWNATTCPTDNYYDDDENDPDALVEIEPEMDLEIQLAFKDFVTYQNKK
ncbi:polyadenylate-binding protein-interacting protein 1 [Contarinia nasturtii]|uniref:polyadenylate-binding protein-interacting protein 1 n=1 Tax=Contarinia nasturtii TaxID=265458 RepID=UPI0012D37864|nr:polyadenylate-binding protein-interacting protein 1 [Contarinia nasturtii]XP_031621960.1 polyadenylate-binding protein-interacting protein 1 [Contarinia nasturtii]